MCCLTLSYPPSICTWLSIFLNLLSVTSCPSAFYSSKFCWYLFCYYLASTFFVLWVFFLFLYCHFSISLEVNEGNCMCAIPHLYWDGLLCSILCMLPTHLELVMPWKVIYRAWQMPCFIDSNLSLIIKFNCYWFNISSDERATLLNIHIDDKIHRVSETSNVD